MKLQFRDLRKDEIDVRIGQVLDSGVTLLLYKDARCDMNILDETVGAMDWQRSHTRDNANCIVSIWDIEKEQWISKEDTGTESNTEKEKGLASDSFKRACTNWGIGRELYTSPFIYVSANDCNIVTGSNGKKVCRDKFVVEAVEVKDKVIVALAIKNAKTGNIVFSFGNKPKAKTEKPSLATAKETLRNAMNAKVKQGMSTEEVVNALNTFNSQKRFTEYNEEEIEKALKFLEVLK